LKIELFRNT